MVGLLSLYLESLIEDGKVKDIFDLTNKVVVITGGAGLLGKEIVQALGFYHAKVFIAEINEIEGKEIVSKYRNDFSVEYVALDITSEESIKRCIQNIMHDQDKIDVWINNAYPRTDDWGVKLEDIPFSSWRKNIDMHLNGYYLCNKYIAEIMKNQGFGSVINFSSIYGVVGPDFSIYEGTQMTMPAAYAAIKAGIINLTRYFAAYYGKYGVRFNCVSPGGIYNNQPEEFVNKYSAKTPLKRMGNRDELNGIIIYLSSDASQFMTGQNLIVDGGWTCV